MIGEIWLTNWKYGLRMVCMVIWWLALLLDLRFADDFVVNLNQLLLTDFRVNLSVSCYVVQFG